MSDFVSPFWDLYVKVIVAVSILACLWLLISQKNAAGSGAAPGQEAEKMDHIWDETLQEYNNPLPKWWSYLFYITVVFSIVYLVLYPGFGNFPGILGWTSNSHVVSGPEAAGSQYGAEMKEAAEKFDPIFEKYAKMDIKAVAADPEAKQIGERLFLTYCSQCHGSDAKGAKGFPNLADGDWMYGGSADAITTSIAEGRMGVMPPYGGNPDAIGGAAGAKEVANYVRSLSGMSSDAALAAAGKAKFEQVCAACHGADGKGMYALGAPNLTDKVWLYGSSEATIMESIEKGRNSDPKSQSFMPAWKNFLGQPKIHLLAAYVYGKSSGHEEPAPAPAAEAAAPAADAAAPAAAPAEGAAAPAAAPAAESK